MSTETDEWLATMRAVRKAGIERDEREVGATRAARLARLVVPENERRSRRLGEVLALSACIAVCALGLAWLRHTLSTPVGFVHEIRADRAQAAPPGPTAEAVIVEATPAVAPPPAEPRVPAFAPAKPKSDTEILPPLPRPTPPSDRAKDGRNRSKLKRFELRIDRSWRKHAPPPRPLPRGRVHEL